MRARVLVIAGSDSSGGAGMLRDLAVLADHDVAACCAVTAITAQTDAQVVGIHHVPPTVVQQQISAALAAHQIDAIKIGMLGTAATVSAVTAALAAHAHIPLIVDPVLRSTSGGRLLDQAGVEGLRQKLLPRTLLLTPNVAEAAELTGASPATDETQLIAQGMKLLDYGVQAVLLKGGHAAGNAATDVLLSADGSIVRFSAPRIAASMRGTGCTLASAIAALIARGVSLQAACTRAKTYVRRQLALQVTESVKTRCFR